MDVTTEPVQIAAESGSMPAALARPTGGGPYPAVIVVMEAFGLNDHIKEVGRRIAAEGFVTLCPDVYYRESPRVTTYDNLPEALRLMGTLWDDKVVADMEAAITFLKASSNVRGDRIGMTGFCMGGRITFLTACRSKAIQAAAPFYGGGIASGQTGPQSPTLPIDLASQLTCPVLAFFGADDPFIPMTDVERVQTTLGALDAGHEVVVYDGAPHGFFCNERDSYRPDAAADAWRRLVRFLHANLD